MLSLFQDFIRQEELFLPNDRILVAVSGGMDSAAMAELFSQSGYSFAIAHCNFKLRGEESDAEEEFVRHLSIHYNVLFHVKRFDTQSYATEKKVSIQMAARDLRYEWFSKLLKEFGYQYLATAHHLDDQVESFLINLSRGTGLAGLHGILPKNGEIIRPLLFASREMIDQYVQSENLDYKEDSSNREDKYLRNRIRLRVIPELEKANPEFRENVLKTIKNIRESEMIYREAIDEKRKQLVRKRREEFRIDIDGLLQLKPIRTWAFELLSPFGFNISTVESIVLSLHKESGKMYFSSTHQLLIDREKMIIQPLEEATDPDDHQSFFINSIKESPKLPLRMHLTVIQPGTVQYTDNPNIAFLDLEKVEFPIQIRKWQTGDYFYPLGMGRKKKLSDLFIDMKVSLTDKRKTWLLCSGGQIAWVIGYRLDDRYKITDETKQVLKIEI